MPASTKSEYIEVWHILAETSVPVAEFGLALSKLAPVCSWIPYMSFTGLLKRWPALPSAWGGAALHKVRFPLQRGYTRLPFGFGTGTFSKTLAMLTAHTADPSQSVLVCTSSFWARTAARWPGPVVYYATDLTTAYSGLSAKSVAAADRAMCAVANLVCPNSKRLAEYLQHQAGCAAGKIVLLPNATRAVNIRSSSSCAREALPDDVPRLSRPIAGVIGNMGDNIDWELVAFAMQQAPDYRWLFVGPLPRSLLTRRSQSKRAEVMRSPHAVFLGARPYDQLFRYARAIDVAVLPYNGIEPTYSGSSTRFYEHLAAGRPMLSTRGVEELLSKEPLLTLVNNAEELAGELRKLQAHPGDGQEAIRCQASRSETWEARASSMQSALQERLAEATSND